MGPAGLTNAKLRETIEEALQNLNEVPDWLDENLRADKGWPSFIEALHTVHHPCESSQRQQPESPPVSSEQFRNPALTAFWDTCVLNARMNLSSRAFFHTCRSVSLEDLKDCAKAVERLAFDELLATQLLFALQRRRSVTWEECI